MLFGLAMDYEFFFQAEYGIRYIAVTGVQTCALPISDRGSGAGGPARRLRPGRHGSGRHHLHAQAPGLRALPLDEALPGPCRRAAGDFPEEAEERSEERRVGKECRSRWSAYH